MNAVCHEHTPTGVRMLLGVVNKQLSLTVASRCVSVQCALNEMASWCLRMLLGFKCYRFISNDEVRRQTNQPLLTEIIQAQHLTLFGHIARMDDNVDTKQILTSSPSVYWKRLPGQPWMTWMKTVQNDLDSHGLSWTNTVDLAQNRPLWRLLATSGTTHS